MLLPFTDGGFKQIAVILIHKQIMQKLCLEGCRDRFRAGLDLGHMGRKKTKKEERQKNCGKRLQSVN